MTKAEKLKRRPARGCADYEALAALTAKRADLGVKWAIPSADGPIDGNSETLTVKHCGYDELRTLLGLLPRLRELDLRKSALSAEETDALRAEYPALSFAYTVRLWGEDYPSDLRALTLSATEPSAAELEAALRRFEGLEALDLRGAALSCAELSELLPFCPADTLYAVPLLGTRYDDDTEEIDLGGVPVDDVGGLEAAVGLLPRLKKLDMCLCGLSDEEMEALGQRHPEVDFVWLITFGGGRYTVRTDLVSFSTLRADFGKTEHRFTDEELAPLYRYCRHLRALDLGHNYIRDITPSASCASCGS